MRTSGGGEPSASVVSKHPPTHYMVTLATVLDLYMLLVYTTSVYSVHQSLNCRNCENLLWIIKNAYVALFVHLLSE